MKYSIYDYSGTNNKHISLGTTELINGTNTEKDQ